MLSEVLSLTASVLYLASAIGVFTFIVLGMLEPAYARWIESKHSMDLEGDLYSQVTEALEKAEDLGKEVQVVLLVGDLEDGEETPTEEG